MLPVAVGEVTAYEAKASWKCSPMRGEEVSVLESEHAVGGLPSEVPRPERIALCDVVPVEQQVLNVERWSGGYVQRAADDEVDLLKDSSISQERRRGLSPGDQ